MPQNNSFFTVAWLLGEASVSLKNTIPAFYSEWFANLQKELLKKANARQGFDDLAEDIESLRSEKETLLLEDANRRGELDKLDELEAFLDEHQEPVTDYDEGLVRRLIERITVFEDRLAFEFKCGLETEVQM